MRESDIDGVRTPHPHARTLKHVVAPWTIGSEALWVGFTLVDEASSTNPHEHANEEVFIVIEGHGSAVVDGEIEAIEPGSVVRVPSGAMHQLVNEGADVLKVACVASPAFTRAEFDVVHQLSPSVSPGGL